MNRNKLVALAHLNFAKNPQILAGPALLADPGLLNQFDKRQGAAIEDGEFEIVQLHNRIVHAQPDKGREQVLGGGDEHALLHETGGIADAGDVAADGFNLKAIQIDAAKHDSRSGRRGKNSHRNRRAAVESYSTAFHGRAHCLL